MADNNGRITMALLSQKLDILTTAVERQDETLDQLVEYTRGNKAGIALNKQVVEQHGEQLRKLAESTDAAIERLNGRVNAWNGGNTILGAAAALLAIVFGNK